MPSITDKPVEDFSFISSDGQTKRLSDFIGKKDYVFVELWVSWSERFIKFIPRLKDIYAKYSDKLEIVTISFDKQQSMWKEALDQQKMPWPQLAEFKGLDSDIAKTYKVEDLPFGLLLDKQGIIVYSIYTPAALEYFMQSKTH